MPDVFTKAKRSEVMSRIRGRGNKETELALMPVFRRMGIAGWRRHVEVRIADCGLRNGTSPQPSLRRGEGAHPRNPQRSTVNRQLTVRPDFVFSKLKVAVFVDGCFWHGCPQHVTWPANRAAWWRRKIRGNQARDRVVNRALRANGWRVLRIWEHELAKKNQGRLVARLSRFCSVPA